MGIIYILLIYFLFISYSLYIIYIFIYQLFILFIYVYISYLLYFIYFYLLAIYTDLDKIIGTPRCEYVVTQYLGHNLPTINILKNLIVTELIFSFLENTVDPKLLSLRFILRKTRPKSV